MDINLYNVRRRSQKRNIAQIIFGLVAIALFLFLSFAIYMLSRNEPPASFPAGAELLIDEGMTVSDVSKKLATEGFVRSSFYAYILLQTQYTDSYIQAGSYSFETPQRTSEIIHAITSGLYTAPLNFVTLPEGFRIKDIANFLPDTFPDIDTAALKQYEGYLFPDTYYITKDTDINKVIELANTTFVEKLAAYDDEIDASGLTLEEVVILASILEREANDEISMRTVAGILLSRLEIGMALQVDATFEYILGKKSDELTMDDLKIDSPYNTYTRTGLPPTPISNPGILAIEAVLNPIESDYLYYITGDDGDFYYAETFEEHKENILLYIQ